jgi:ABC-type Fe3+-hydroxamate transport system substrate-binding protein
VQGVGTPERDRTFRAVREIKPGFRSEALPMTTLADVRSAIRRIGEIAECPDAADAALKRFDGKIERVRKRVASLGRPRVLFASDYHRPLVAGPDNFTHDLIEIAGGVNCGVEIRGPRPWRRAGLEAILSARPDVLLCEVSAGEAEAARKHWLALNDLPAARSGRVFIVTDRRWTIPSTHLADLAQELADMIHPQPADGARP